MTTSDPSVIIDDFNPSFQFDLTAWSATRSLISYMETRHVATSDAPTQDQQHPVTILFEGTSLAIFGQTPSPGGAETETFTVIIDGGEPITNIHYGDTNPPSYGQWYQSPVLSETEATHNITLLNITGASIDYAVATIGTGNPAGRPVIVDDTDTSVIYSGIGWNLNNSTFDGGNITAYKNHTHRTNAIGDSFSYIFSGDSTVEIYGVVDFTSALGNLTFSESVDGVVVAYHEIQDQTRTSEILQQEGVTQVPNYLLSISPQNLSPGEHVIELRILNCTDQTFYLDYITYLSNDKSTFESPTSSVPTKLSGTSKSRVGAIAGGIVGGVAFILLLTVLVHCVQRRKRQLRTRFAYPFSHARQDTLIALQPVLPREVFKIGEEDSGMDS